MRVERIVSSYMDVINLWTPVYASTTSWVGQWYLLTNYPELVSEQALNALTSIIDDFRQELAFDTVSYLEAKRTTLELCIEDGIEEFFAPKDLPPHELDLSLLLSLLVLIQSSTWEANASQLRRGPELLKSVFGDYSEERAEVGADIAPLVIIDFHIELLAQMRVEGIDGIISKKIALDGDTKHYSKDDIISTTKVISRKYKKLKHSHVETYGYVSQARIIEILRDAPTYLLSKCDDDTIEAFAQLMCAESPQDFEDILSQKLNCFENDSLDKLTMIESGDVRGLLSHFHSVDVIRILTSVKKTGFQETMSRVRDQFV